jgi:sulfur-carrier protein
MAVTVKIPPQLRAATGGESALTAEGGTVGDVLNALYERHGELRERVADESGAPRRFVNVFLDGEDIRFLDGLQTPVAEGAELQILPAVAGG